MMNIKRTTSIFLLSILALMLLFTTSFAIVDDSVRSANIKDAEILGVKGQLKTRAPRLSIKEIDYSKVIEEKYLPLTKEAYFLSSARDERTLIRMSVKLDTKPAAVVGFNEKEGYIEYLPYNYDEKEKKVEFTAENNMAIIPLSYNKAYIDTLSEKEISAKAISISDKHFNITSNYDGFLSVDIETLYNTADTLYYKIYQDSTLIKDKAYIDSSSLSTSFPNRGVYRLEIFKKNSIWFDTKLWEQEVYIEDNPLSSSDKNTINDLAVQYAPILTLSENEEYKPIKLTDILDNPSYKLALNTKNGTKRLELPTIKDYIRYNGYCKALLEGHWGLGTVSDSLENLPISSYDPHIYYSYSFTDREYVINYHFFYSFDPKTPSTSIAAHNLDREQISITFNRTTLEPENIYYPQHLIGHDMGLRSDSDSSVNNIKKDNNTTLETTWKGYVKIEFSTANNNNMVYNNTHPIIAIAQGSHAPYPLNGIYVANSSNEPAGIINEAIAADSFLIPSEIYDNRPSHSDFTSSNSYNLSALAIENIISGDSTPTSLNLLAFSGDWVDIVGLNNEAFPPFIDIMRDVEGYVNETMKSNKHTFTLTNVPESVITRTNNIKSYLDNNLNQ